MTATIIIGISLYILFTHFVADFIKQTNEQARGKSSSIYWLTSHIFSYGQVMAASAIIFTIGYGILGYNWVDLITPISLYVIINMVLHWLTDYFTSKETKKLWLAEKVHEFFIMVGLDQYIHQVSLLGTFWLLFL